MKRILLSITLLSILGSGFSQTFMRRYDWKKHRKEYYISMGVSNFLGDLGGADFRGTDYHVKDINLELTRQACGAAFRYKLQPWINVSAKFSYIHVRGDDAQTKDIYRNNRNLRFKSNIFELAGRIEFGWQSNKHGNRYGIRGTLIRRMKNNQHGIFLFTGLGGFYYNPKAQAPNGEFVALRDLHTEGQGLPGRPKKYSNYSVCIPVGIYYKISINKRWSFGLEAAWRKTYTDYIDDVSTTYYDKNALAEVYGPLSAQFSDPNLGLIPGATSPDGFGNPAQRGDNEKDSYITAEMTVGFIIQQKRRRLRSKF